jgi:anthranilate synthase/aminodeoxychorismate synthase-like glutamine amidotransferase
MIEKTSDTRILEGDYGDQTLFNILYQLRVRNPGQDELMLISGGPINDRSKTSMIPVLGDLRVVFKQPAGESHTTHQDPLNGSIDLSKKNPLILEVQQRFSNQWSTRTIESHHSLELALHSMRKMETQAPSEPRTGLSPGGFAGILGYDLGQWTTGSRLSNPPPAGEILGVMWKTNGWIIHHRDTRSISLVGLENISLADIERWAHLDHAPVESIEPSSPVSIESRSEHEFKTREIIQAIKHGHVYQVNYGRRWEAPLENDPWSVFSKLNRTNPAPYSSWMRSPSLEWSVVSASPEQLLRIRDGIISTSPIKGTTPRGKDPAEDSERIDLLIKSKKDLAEHMMLVDLERHDLSSVCEPGSVIWSDFRIESHPNVHHLVSTVEGLVAHGSELPAAISSLFPGGSITGCPKTMSMSIIDYLEGTPRGAWTGSVGHINFTTGIADLSILIRTLDVRLKDSINIGSVMAGGGIVHDSIPSVEVEEAEWKADAITRATWGAPAFKDDLSPPTAEMGGRTLLMPSSNDKGTNFTPLQKTPKIILVDNLDSFTFNIRDAMVTLGSQVEVVEGRPASSTEDPNSWLKRIISEYTPDGIVIGPGPSRPEASERTMLIASNALSDMLSIGGRRIPVLGICLGHQALCLADGSRLEPSPEGPVHGSPSRIEHRGTGLFENSDKICLMMRYNSLAVVSDGRTMMPNAWESGTRLVMGVEHPSLPIHGVQFHPESAGSRGGSKIFYKFLETCIQPQC